MTEQRVTTGEADGPLGTGVLFVGSNRGSTDTIDDTNSGVSFGTTASFPQGTFDVGQGLRVTAYGVYSTAAAGTTVLVDVNGGGSAFCDNGTTLIAGNAANRQWRVVADVVRRSATQIEANGQLFLSTSPGVAVIHDMESPNPVNINLGALVTLGIKWTWGTLDPANVAILRTLVVEDLALVVP